MSSPSISIIVIAYKIPKQLGRTLHSLSCNYQLNVKEHDYEVIVIENASDECVCEDYVLSFGSNFRYFRRNDKTPSPVSAVNFGFKQCKGSFVGLIIDGAYMVTPRVVQYALMSRKAVPHPVVVVPGYHLGNDIHENNHISGHDQLSEQHLLDRIGWPTNGYRLFEVATLSYANRHGYFHPIMECNCVFAPLVDFARIGFCDEHFTHRGGGSINLHLYRQLGTLPESEVVVLPGEGAFHQFHGGVSTSHYEDRHTEIQSHKKQLDSFWDGNFQAVRKEPILFGAVTYWAQNYLSFSSAAAKKRFDRLSALGRKEWEDAIDPLPSRPHLSIEEATEFLKTFLE